MRFETNNGLVVQADTEAFVAALIMQLGPEQLRAVLKHVESLQFQHTVEATRSPLIHSGRN